MKTIILIIMLVPTLATSQLLDLPVSRVLNIKGSEIATYTNSNGFQVPEGKVWQYVSVTGESITDAGNQLYYDSPLSARLYIYTSQGSESLDVKISRYFLIPEYTRFFITSDEHHYQVISIIEYDLNAQNLTTDSNYKNDVRLFPNPSSSVVALNSNKQYDIEVCDIAGNKVMALSGNTINMAHLSTATYIVNAIDKETNEKLSYKVIKK